MTSRAPVHERIVCGGMALDDNNQPVGEPCGRVYHHQCSVCLHVADQQTWQLVPNEVHADVITESARAAGWRIGPARTDGSHDTMCPRCGKPDPALASITRDLLAPGRT